MNSSQNSYDDKDLSSQQIMSRDLSNSRSRHSKHSRISSERKEVVEAKTDMNSSQNSYDDKDLSSQKITSRDQSNSRSRHSKHSRISSGIKQNAETKTDMNLSQSYENTQFECFSQATITLKRADESPTLFSEVLENISITFANVSTISELPLARKDTTESVSEIISDDVHIGLLRRDEISEPNLLTDKQKQDTFLPTLSNSEKTNNVRDSRSFERTLSNKAHEQSRVRGVEKSEKEIRRGEKKRKKESGTKDIRKITVDRVVTKLNTSASQKTYKHGIDEEHKHKQTMQKPSSECNISYIADEILPGLVLKQSESASKEGRKTNYQKEKRKVSSVGISSGSFSKDHTLKHTDSSKISKIKEDGEKELNLNVNMELDIHPVLMESSPIHKSINKSACSDIIFGNHILISNDCLEDGEIENETSVQKKVESFYGILPDKRSRKRHERHSGKSRRFETEGTRIAPNDKMLNGCHTYSPMNVQLENTDEINRCLTESVADNQDIRLLGKHGSSISERLLAISNSSIRDDADIGLETRHIEKEDLKDQSDLPEQILQTIEIEAEISRDTETALEEGELVEKKVSVKSRLGIRKKIRGKESRRDLERDHSVSDDQFEVAEIKKLRGPGKKKGADKEFGRRDNVTVEHRRERSNIKHYTPERFIDAGVDGKGTNEVSSENQGSIDSDLCQQERSIHNVSARKSLRDSHHRRKSGIETHLSHSGSTERDVRRNSRGSDYSRTKSIDAEFNRKGSIGSGHGRKKGRDADCTRIGGSELEGDRQRGTETCLQNESRDEDCDRMNVFKKNDVAEFHSEVDFERHKGDYADHTMSFSSINDSRMNSIESDRGRKRSIEADYVRKHSIEANERRKRSIEADGGRKRSIEADGGRKRSIEADGGRNRSIEIDGGRKRSIEADGGRKRSIEADSGRKRSIEADSGRKRSIEADSGRKRSIEANSGRKRSIEADYRRKRTVEADSDRKKSIEADYPSKIIYNETRYNRRCFDSDALDKIDQFDTAPQNQRRHISSDYPLKTTRVSDVNRIDRSPSHDSQERTEKDEMIRRSPISDFHKSRQSKDLDYSKENSFDDDCNSEASCDREVDAEDHRELSDNRDFRTRNSEHDYYSDTRYRDVQSDRGRYHGRGFDRQYISGQQNFPADINCRKFVDASYPPRGNSNYSFRGNPNYLSRGNPNYFRPPFNGSPRRGWRGGFRGLPRFFRGFNFKYGFDHYVQEWSRYLTYGDRRRDFVREDSVQTDFTREGSVATDWNGTIDDRRSWESYSRSEGDFSEEEQKVVKKVKKRTRSSRLDDNLSGAECRSSSRKRRKIDRATSKTKSSSKTKSKKKSKHTSKKEKVKNRRPKYRKLRLQTKSKILDHTSPDNLRDEGLHSDDDTFKPRTIVLEHDDATDLLTKKSQAMDPASANKSTDVEDVEDVIARMTKTGLMSKKIIKSYKDGIAVSRLLMRVKNKVKELNPPRVNRTMTINIPAKIAGKCSAEEPEDLGRKVRLELIAQGQVSGIAQEDMSVIAQVQVSVIAQEQESVIAQEQVSVIEDSDISGFSAEQEQLECSDVGSVDGPILDSVNCQIDRVSGSNEEIFPLDNLSAMLECIPAVLAHLDASPSVVASRLNLYDTTTLSVAGDVNDTEVDVHKGGVERVFVGTQEMTPVESEADEALRHQRVMSPGDSAAEPLAYHRVMTIFQSLSEPLTNQKVSSDINCGDNNKRDSIVDGELNTPKLVRECSSLITPVSDNPVVGILAAAHCDTADESVISERESLHKTAVIGTDREQFSEFSCDVLTSVDVVEESVAALDVAAVDNNDREDSAKSPVPASVVVNPFYRSWNDNESAFLDPQASDEGELGSDDDSLFDKDVPDIPEKKYEDLIEYIAGDQPFEVEVACGDAFPCTLSGDVAVSQLAAPFEASDSSQSNLESGTFDSKDSDPMNSAMLMKPPSFIPARRPAQKLGLKITDTSAALISSGVKCDLAESRKRKINLEDGELNK